MDDREYVCTFGSNASNYYDFVKSETFLNLFQYLFIIILPLYVVLFVRILFTHNVFSILFSLFTLVLMLSIVFGYRRIMVMIIKKNRNSLYGNKNVENKIVFGDKIVITTGENRTVLEYSAIKKIVPSGNIYALYLTGINGTFFPKNSCADATDDELLAMLVDRTGAKIKGRSRLAIVITVLATVAVAIYSALWAFSIFSSL